MRVVWALLFVLSGLTNSAVADDNALAQQIATRMTREAIAAGAAGDMALRNDLLTKASRVAPDHAPVHWAQGEMKVGDEWQTIGEIQDLARNDERLVKYNELKSHANNTVDSNLQLARWCRKQKLADEARYHWLNVLAADKDNREALLALDSAWVDGKLLNKIEANALRDEQRRNRKIDKKWVRRIAGWHRALSGSQHEADAALADLEAEVDERAIPAFERLAEGDRRATSAERRRDEQLCNAFVLALANMPSYEATASLVRHAILAQSDLVRATASNQLKHRPRHECIPLLIAGLAAPIESSFQILRTSTGRASYSHEFFTKGRSADEVTEVAKSATVAVRLSGDESRDQLIAASQRANGQSFRQAQRFQAEAQQLEQLAANTNAYRKQMNGRIIPVLEKLTGKILGDDPSDWWDYWSEENGYDTSYRETKKYRTSIAYVEPLPPRPACECFAAGTLVWTKTGMQAIETLTAGDLVLSMNAETGERCFRPVLATTVRPPSGLMHVSVGTYNLRATPGHPFWVEGTGWRMSKELTAGDRVLSAEGAPMLVNAVKKFDPATEHEEEAFNLIVEGTNNYFVGQEGILSHDNTPRRPDLVRAGKW